jgi:protein ImuA
MMLSLPSDCRPRPASDLLRAAAQGAAERQPTLVEIFAETPADGAPTGFVLAHLKPGARVLWAQDRLSLKEAGRPCLAGLPAGLDLLHLTVGRPADVLWAMEQALGCADLDAVLGEVWGEAAVLDFTATRRLALRAEAHGVAAWLIRRAATPGLSAARERWRVASLPSAPDPFDPRAPGQPLWHADLFRARWRAPATWVVRHDRAAGRLDFMHGTEAAAPGDAAAAPAPLRAAL